MTLPDYVISTDPGLKTGLALVASDGPNVLMSCEADVLDVERMLMTMIGLTQRRHLSEPSVVLPVVEQFTITARTVRNSQAPWSLEVTGIVRNLFWRELVTELVMQKPDVMVPFPSGVLHAVDCWHKGGAGHANDAIRHALAALHRRGWRDRRMILS